MLCLLVWWTLKLFWQTLSPMVSRVRYRMLQNCSIYGDLGEYPVISMSRIARIRGQCCDLHTWISIPSYWHQGSPYTLLKEIKGTDRSLNFFELILWAIYTVLTKKTMCSFYFFEQYIWNSSTPHCNEREHIPATFMLGRHAKCRIRLFPITSGFQRDQPSNATLLGRGAK